MLVHYGSRVERWLGVDEIGPLFFALFAATCAALHARGFRAIDAEERARAAGFDVRGVAILAHPAAGQATNSCVTSGP